MGLAYLFALRVLTIAFVFAAVAGCTSVDPYAAAPIAQRLEREDAIGYCARLFADIDRRIDTLGVRDAEAPRVAGFPYLRVDRLSAALGQQSVNNAQQSAWRARLQHLDEIARASELANAALSVDDLPRCRALLAAADAYAIGELRAAAAVPDRYSLLLRVLGVYPLTRLPFAVGVAKWQTNTRDVFAAPPETLPVRGRLQRYAPAGRSSTPALPLTPPVLDALGVPQLRAHDVAALLVRHAPVLEIDVAADFDRPGALVLDRDDRVIVDTKSPVLYTRLTYTLIGGLIHPQLTYSLWFSERPAAAGQAFNLLAGKLDGVVWRVTLDHAGEALVYDTMHACGCYHLFFPTENARPRDLPATLDDSLFVPQTVRAPRTGERVVLRIESGSHYLQRVQITGEPDTGSADYALRDERTLTALTRSAGGTRSVYGSNGLISGSERAERWLFWPMGIASAGQMRQWGHHATAFVGRRHFDDPLLFDAYFEIDAGRIRAH